MAEGYPKLQHYEIVTVTLPDPQPEPEHDPELPRRATPYLSGFNHETSEDEVDLYCPECGMPVSFSWGDLEANTLLDCEACGYEWVSTGGDPL